VRGIEHKSMILALRIVRPAGNHQRRDADKRETNVDMDKYNRGN
jgi:hypothetical protein